MDKCKKCGVFLPSSVKWAFCPYCSEPVSITEGMSDKEFLSKIEILLECPTDWDKTVDAVLSETRRRRAAIGG
jgi:hypothetical protein